LDKNTTPQPAPDNPITLPSDRLQPGVRSQAPADPTAQSTSYLTSLTNYPLNHLLHHACRVNNTRNDASLLTTDSTFIISIIATMRIDHILHTIAA
jgi:hypothetical protein